MTEEDQALLERVDRARRQVAAPLERLRKNSARTGRGQAMALYGFLEEIGCPGGWESGWRNCAGGEPALAEEYRQLWEILCGGLEQCAALTGGGAYGAGGVLQSVPAGALQYDVGTIPVSLDRVTAGETTRQAGHRVKVLFLLGADDSSIPQVGAELGLLSDDDRTLLASYGLELNQSAEERLYREMTTLYQICALPSRRLILTWPAQGAGGGAAVLLPGGAAEAALPRPCRGAGGGTGGLLPHGGPPARLGAGGAEPGSPAGDGVPAGVRPQVERLERAGRWEQGRLTRGAVDRLYGQRVPMSASRMDKYKSCHFSYFMRYGLQAEPRKPAGFTAPEYGTFVHYVLEHVLQSCPIGGGELGEELQKRLRAAVRAAVDRYTAEELGGLEHQSQRFRYLFRRLLRSVQAVVDNVAQELCASRFRPISFELGFGSRGELPPVELTAEGVTISVSGFVDRVDGWVENGRLHLRVVDYKTGRKSFDLTEVWNGLGLQMLLYLFALEERGRGSTDCR